MQNLKTPPNLRRFAADLRDYYADSRMQSRAEIFATRMEARADLEDALANTHSGIADCCIVEQNVPLLGTIKINGGKRIDIQYPYFGIGEKQGIYVNFEWRADPGCEERDGTLVRLYLGHRDTGPQAHYEADTNQWYRLTGRGNHGKRYASGGTWHSEKVSLAPEIINRLEKIIQEEIMKKLEQEIRIAQAEARLKAADLRVRAHCQREQASACTRQADHPAYPGQDGVCLGKAGTLIAYADRTEAEADLILARAGL